MRERARDLLDNVGQLARGLHPPSLDALGFVGALTELVDAFSDAHAITVDLALSPDFDPTGISKATQLVLYRAVQEALTNVARHAAASHVDVHLARVGDEISLHVADDGKGFVPDTKPTGIGLQLMRRRLALIRGRMSLRAQPSRGTTLDITVPLASPHD